MAAVPDMVDRVHKQAQNSTGKFKGPLPIKDSKIVVFISQSLLSLQLITGHQQCVFNLTSQVLHVYIALCRITDGVIIWLQLLACAIQSSENVHNADIVKEL